MEKESFASFFPVFRFFFFFRVFFDPSLGSRSCREKCSNAVDIYIILGGEREKKLAIRGNRGRVPISPIINLVSVGRRVKRSFIRAEDRCAFIELAIQKCPWCAIPSRPLPSLAVTLREPCVAERIKNTVFSLSLFFGSRLPILVFLSLLFFFFFIYREKWLY